MKDILTHLRTAIFSLALVGSLGFGASQAFAFTEPAEATNCTECAELCGVIELCYDGYCSCA